MGAVRASLPGAYPLHPDATGMAGMAAVLESTMEAAGTR